MRDFKHGPLRGFRDRRAASRLLILKQPDFGSTVMIALILFAMLFAAGARWKHLRRGGRRRAGRAGIPGGGEILPHAPPDRPFSIRGRSRAAPASSLMQSFIALGEGGKWGVGLGAGRQKMFYLPQAHTDFVFAVVGEEFGLIGARSRDRAVPARSCFAGCGSRTTNPIRSRACSRSD